MPGIEKALGIRLALEGKLHRVCLLHAAFLQRVTVRIEDRTAHVLVDADDLVQPLLARVAHDGQAEAGDLAVETHEFQMSRHLVAEQFGQPGCLLDMVGGTDKGPGDR